MSNLDSINPLKDKSNPQAVINIVPSSVSTALALIPDDVFAMTEEELRQAGETSQYEEMLRIAFWKEYDSALHAKRDIKLVNIYGGVCNQHYFLKKVCGNSFRLAYVLSLPKDYEVEMTDIQLLANKRVREILSEPLHDDKGVFKDKLANTIHKIWETSLDRVRGSVITRNESRNLTAQINMDSQPKAHNDLTLEEIEKKLEKLELMEPKPSRSVSEDSELIDVEQEPTEL